MSLKQGICQRNDTDKTCCAVKNNIQNKESDAKQNNQRFDPRLFKQLVGVIVAVIVKQLYSKSQQCEYREQLVAYAVCKQTYQRGKSERDSYKVRVFQKVLHFFISFLYIYSEKLYGVFIHQIFVVGFGNKLFELVKVLLI